jgi:hypothetical protein
MLLVGNVAYSQENRTEFCVDFRANVTSIDSSYVNNAERLSDIASFLQKVKQDSTLSLVNVSFYGVASPEGSYQWNHKLARARLESLEKVVRNEIEIPDSIVVRDDSYISWEYLAEQVVESD